eukprot:m.111516 g.111516  ORF g.111516 m.111516 type:complete len:395 (-) comp14063_c0_seq14:979-2163(-)
MLHRPLQSVARICNSRIRALATYVTQDEFASSCCKLDLSPKDKVVVALSGGPDSMALLYLAKRYFERVAAVTINHGIRAESEDEAVRVQKWASELGVEACIRSLQLHASPNQGEARRGRYAALTQFCLNEAFCTPCDGLLTAHHLDDKIETVLMRIGANSGINGLNGIPSKRLLQSNKLDSTLLAEIDPELRARLRSGPNVYRPLLSFRKEQLIATCREYNLNFVEDPSNSDTRYKRNNIREALQNLYKTIPAEDVEHLANTLCDVREQVVLACAQWQENDQVYSLNSTGDSATLDIDALLAKPKTMAHFLLTALVSAIGNSRRISSRHRHVEEVLSMAIATRHALEHGDAIPPPWCVGGCVVSIQAKRNNVFQHSKQKSKKLILHIRRQQLRA